MNVDSLSICPGSPPLIATHPKANRGVAKIQLTYVTG